MKRRRIVREVINKRKFITDPKQIINQLHKRKGVNKVALAQEERLKQHGNLEYKTRSKQRLC